MSEPVDVLRVSGLQASYGDTRVLHGVDFHVRRGELVSLLGRNGAGRTTTLKAVMGLVDRRSGSVRIDGVEAIDRPPHRIARMKVGYCPEERGIYASLSAEENLLLLPVVGDGGMGLDEIYELFPNLAVRRRSQGTRLSGGEQQMLVEQNFRFVAPLADRHYVLEQGRVVETVAADELQAKAGLLERYLTV
jgi:branched-chain amino acid transport system ATP-binding protein